MKTLISIISPLANRLQQTLTTIEELRENPPVFEDTGEQDDKAHFIGHAITFVFIDDDGKYTLSACAIPLPLFASPDNPEVYSNTLDGLEELIKIEQQEMENQLNESELESSYESSDDTSSTD